jgi:hypothetical protein
VVEFFISSINGKTSKNVTCVFNGNVNFQIIENIPIAYEEYIRKLE